MKEIKVTVNTWYVVEGAAGATVINPLTNRAIATVEDGKQASFLATTPYVVASDDSVNVFKAPFNSAPAKLKLLGLLGGGVLSAGYLEALFLESNGKEYLLIDEPFNSPISGVRVTLSRKSNSLFNYMWQMPPNTNATASGSRGAIVLGIGDSNIFLSGRYACWGVTIPYVPEKEITMSYNWCNNNLHQINDEASEKTAKDNWIKESNYQISTKHQPLFCSYLEHLGKVDSFAKGMRLYNANFSQGSDVTRNLVPAITLKTGEACMHDKISLSDFTNSGSGSFVVGMTARQARLISLLPSSGGNLTISLPSTIVSEDMVTDSAVNAALTTARAKGWSITVQSYTEDATSAASTFGLRRIWVRKTQDESGTYVDAEGNRWQVDWCVTMYTPDDSTPDQHGYELFRSVEAACEYWGLEPYVDPAWEEEFLTNQEL